MPSSQITHSKGATRMAYSGTSGSGYDADADRAAKLVKTLASVVGAVFLLVGILGFIPGIVTNYSNLHFLGPKPFGHANDPELLGLFHISILHNIVHLLFGVAGLAMARTAKSATSYLLGGGVIYLVLTVYGFLISGRQNSATANFVPLNNADNVLHLLLGL